MCTGRLRLSSTSFLGLCLLKQKTRASSLNHSFDSEQMLVLQYVALLVLVYYKGVFSSRVAHPPFGVMAGCSEPGHDADSFDIRLQPCSDRCKACTNIGPVKSMHLLVYVCIT